MFYWFIICHDFLSSIRQSLDNVGVNFQRVWCEQSVEPMSLAFLREKKIHMKALCMNPLVPGYANMANVTERIYQVLILFPALFLLYAVLHCPCCSLTVYATTAASKN